MSDFFSLLTLSLGLSADAFAVAVCKGLALGRRRASDAAIVGGWFGFFQAIMPIIGCLAGRIFCDAIDAIDHWLSFALLCMIGLHMLFEAYESDVKSDVTASLSPTAMLAPSIACSIDALAVGVVLSFSPSSRLLPSAVMIGVSTCLLSALGVYIAGSLGSAYRAKAEGFGGILLVLLGIKILICDLFDISLPF